jgi:O-antigen/teichoic acid export membrane protein
MPTTTAIDILVACFPSRLRGSLTRLAGSDVGRRLAHGALWSIAGAVVSRGLMLTAMVLVARMLGRTGYGEFGMVRSTVDMFVAFAGFGLGLTATKHVAEFRRSDPQRAGRIIGLSWLVTAATGGAMALSLFILAPWLAEHTLRAPHLASVLRIGAVILFVNTANSAQIGVLSGFEAFRATAVINLLAGVVSFAALIGGAYFGGLAGAVWALAFSLAVNWFLNHLALRSAARQHQVPLSFAECTREMAVLWRFSLPAVLAGVMVGPVRWVCNALLARQPHGYDEIGLLSAALVFQQIVLSANEMLNAPLLSVISSTGTRMSERLGAVNILSSWIPGAAFAVVLLCFPETAHVLFGEDFSSRRFTTTLAMVVFCTAVMAFKAGLARALAANNLLWWGFFSNLFWAVVLIGSATFTVRWGAPGLAAALALAYIANTVVLAPLYCSRNLIPRGMLLSRDSALIWFVLAALMCVNCMNVSLQVRAILFGPSVALCAVAFIRLMKPCFAERHEEKETPEMKRK